MRRSVRNLVILSGIAALAAIFLVSGFFSGKREALEIREAYAFATTPVQKNGAVFMRIFNNRGENDRIVGVSAADAAEKAELHTNDMSGGMMQMRRVDAFDLPARKEFALKPAGDHVMLRGLKAPLRAGDVFRIRLTSERGGEIEIPVTVRNPGDAP